MHRDDAQWRSAGRRAALSRDALRLLRVDDRRGRAGDQSLSVEPGPGPRADAADHLRLAVQPAPADGIVVVDVQLGGGVPARSRSQPDGAPGRLSRRMADRASVLSGGSVTGQSDLAGARLV